MSSPHYLSLHSALPARALMVVGSLVLATALAAYSAKPTLARWAGLITLLAAGLATSQVRRQPNRLEINPDNGELIVHYRRWLGTSSKRIPLAPFSLVRSYSQGSQLPISVVELATTEALPRALRLATFQEPMSKEPRLLAAPRFVEAPAARALRTRLAATGLFHDEGYLEEFPEHRALDA